jgi:hypothetical protein
MSKLNVNAIEPSTGTDITLGASGDTTTVPSGATIVNSGTATGFSVALDDISTGDAASTLATSAGNITIDAQGDNTDVIIKGTDGGSDITALTIDMSDGGILQTRAGIGFPGTQVSSTGANVLDDYEEGTWTAVLSDGTNDATMSAGVGWYTKIGNMVFLLVDIGTSSLGSVSGSIRITGLPFTSANVSRNYGFFHSGNTSGLNITAGMEVTGYVDYNKNYIELSLPDVTTGTSAMQASEWTDDGRMYAALCVYQTTVQT